MPYFTTEELRALPDMDDADRFSDERLDAAHDWIAGIIRRECETSFITETITETLSGRGFAGLTLTDPYAIAISSVVVDGETVTGTVIDAGLLYQASDARWSSTTRGNVTITYTAGYSTEPPADLKEAALRAARHWLLTMDGWSGVDERSTSLTNEFGNVNLSTPGEDRPTGLPMVDSTIMAWARKVRVPKVS